MAGQGGPTGQVVCVCVCVCMSGAFKCVLECVLKCVWTPHQTPLCRRHTSTPWMSPLAPLSSCPSSTPRAASGPWSRVSRWHAAALRAVCVCVRVLCPRVALCVWHSLPGPSQSVLSLPRPCLARCTSVLAVKAKLPPNLPPALTLRRFLHHPHPPLPPSLPSLIQAAAPV